MHVGRWIGMYVCRYVCLFIGNVYMYVCMYVCTYPLDERQTTGQVTLSQQAGDAWALTHQLLIDTMMYAGAVLAVPVCM